MNTSIPNKLAAHWPPPFLRGRRLAQMTLAYIAGLLLCAYSGVSPTIPGVLALPFGVGAVLCWWHDKKVAGKNLLGALLLCGMVALGCFTFARAEAQSASFPVPPGEEASLYGRVKAESVASGENRYRLI